MGNLAARYLKWINPLTVLSDAFYCLSVYDNPARYTRDMWTLAIMSVICIAIAFSLLGGNAMTVFKGFLLLLKRESLAFILLSLSQWRLSLQFSMGDNQPTAVFRSSATRIAIEDQDRVHFLKVWSAI